MATRAEQLRRERIAVEHAVADAERRMEHVRYYVQVSAPGAAAASATSHAMWCAYAAELADQIATLRQRLSH